jgi:hypothetical protein
MLACMKHDPSYSIGLYSNDIFSISVGVLSHKGSFSDCMPVMNAQGDVILLDSRVCRHPSNTYVPIKFLIVEPH